MSDVQLARAGGLRRQALLASAARRKETDMRLAILGGTGRIGGHVLNWALDAGYPVTELARSPEALLQAALVQQGRGQRAGGGEAPGPEARGADTLGPLTRGAVRPARRRRTGDRAPRRREARTQ